MKTWVRKSLKVGVLSAGILLFAGGTAQADWNTSDNDGVLTGNQLGLSVDVPINICGNAVAVLGDAMAGCEINGGGGGAEEAGDWDSSGNGGIGTGNQVFVPVHVPINICGNAVGVLGDAGAECTIGGEGAGAGNTYEAAPVTESWDTSDNDGVGTGNQVLAVLDAPINVCGNAVGVLGDAMAGCEINPGDGAGADEAGDWTTSGNDGVLTGNQVAAILHVPVNVCGNALAILGDAGATCTINGSGDDNGDDDGNGDDGDDDDDNGGGTGDDYDSDEGRRGHREALPVVGEASALRQLTQVVKTDSVLGGARQESSRTESWTTTDNDGVLTGNQVALAIDLPLTIAGNAVAVLGDSVAGAKI
jgi:hypothetical protein